MLRTGQADADIDGFVNSIDAYLQVFPEEVATTQVCPHHETTLLPNLHDKAILLTSGNIGI